MAPRSAGNLVIAVSGTHSGYKQAQLKALVEGLGATFSSSMSAEWTHLVATPKDIEKQSTKYKAACEKEDCRIVSLDWLVKSSQSRKPVSEKDYLLGAHKDENGQDKPENTKDSTMADGLDDGQADSKGVDPVTASAKGIGQTGFKKGETGTTRNGKKRCADQAAGAEGESNKKIKDAQKASSKTLNIPVDEGFVNETIHFPNPEVHIDDSGLIWDATLNQTKAAANNNKFYVIQLLKSSTGQYITWTRWGRVGERGQSAALGGDSLKTCISWFEKKFREKSGHKWENRLDPPKPGKYTFLERDYEEDDEDDEEIKKEPKEEKSEVESTLSKPLQNLVSFIFNPEHFISAMASMSYDAKKLPLGKLSDRTLKMGFSILKELSEMIADPSLARPKYGVAYAAAIEDLSNRYFTTIPHVFGRNRPPVINSDAQIKKEIELLEALTDMDVANEIMKDAREADEINQLDRQFQSLGMEEMTRLDPKSEEFTELANYLSNSRGATHYLNYKVIDIFRIERKGENERFLSSPYAKLQKSDRRLLWHGSRSTNFGGILSQGLRIAPPEAPVNGYMFGKGVYLADTSSKSANYCCPYNSANMGLLLLCDVELGDPMLELCDSDYMAGENAKKEGKIATLGQGQSIPGGWKDAECLHPTLKGVKMPDVSVGSSNRKDQAWLQYNEYIVYDVAQIRQRYLFYVHMR